MNKIDKRKTYILVLDTETANTIVDDDGKLVMKYTLTYDTGWSIIDKKGNVYRYRSFVNRDIFVDERELMRSAYYANKIPQYLEDIKHGSRIMSDTYNIRKTMLDDIREYNVKYVCAHNARFDYNALNNTQRWTTKSKYRYWFPYNSIEWLDSLAMARSVIGKMPTYKKFCKENGYMTKNNQCRFTAEVLYKFITNNNEFIESHTALEDVLIEKEIVAYCFKQKKKMVKKLFKNT